MLAGIDVGSTGLKLALYSEDGCRIGYAYREYAIQYGQNGRAVLDADIWWDSLASCAHTLAAQVDLSQLRAIGISSANAMILTDANNAPLFPAIMQLDKRGAEMVPQINRELDGEMLFSNTGNRNAPGYQWGPTLKWLQTHRPEELARVRRIFNPTSYLAARLTGVYYMDLTRAATTLLCQAEQQRWDEELWHYFGLSACEKPEIAVCCQLVGYTRSGEIFPAGIPVAAGGIDTICAMMGLTGRAAEDVLILGSVGRFAARVSRWDPHFLNTFSYDGTQKISMTPVNNVGTALKWVRALTGSSDYGEMNRLAAEIPPGSEGLLFLPYLNGASCPRWDETIRGTFLGLEAYHGPGHLIRSVMEGAAFSLGESQALLAQCGCRTDLPLYCGGGGAKSPTWMQIFSDLLGRPLLLPEQTETETLGAAILAGIAAGILQPAQAAEWNPVLQTVYPNPDGERRYQELLNRFSESHTFLRPLYSMLCTP